MHRKGLTRNSHTRAYPLEEIMQVFIAAVSLALIVSFLCSIFESVLLSINHAQVEALVQQDKRTGRLLKEFKQHIDVPIAAILITNTIAHTVGTAVAGATYEDAFSAETLWIFTIVFTMAVLLFTEIIPKTLGVTHARRLAMPVAYGIHALAVALRPLVLLSGGVSRWLRGGKDAPVTSIEEIRLLTALGRTEGVVGANSPGTAVFHSQ
jgi:CBS domain containing-hemolysin-like protein